MLWLSVADIGSCASHEISGFRPLTRSQHRSVTDKCQPQRLPGPTNYNCAKAIAGPYPSYPSALGPAWALTQQTLNKNEHARKSSVVISRSTLILVGDAVHRQRFEPRTWS